MAGFFERLARATPVAFANALRSQPRSGYRISFGALAAVSGGISYLYYVSSPDMVHLDKINEELGPKVALNPDKWIEFKLQDTARVSHNTQLCRICKYIFKASEVSLVIKVTNILYYLRCKFSFDPTAKLGLDIASCILTRAPLGQDAEGKPKYVVGLYTPISDPDVKGYFDLLIKVYPEGKMSQHFASLKPGDVVEVKGPLKSSDIHPI